jgi:hypothetical protein
LVKNFRFSISRSSSSYTYTKHVRESIWSQLPYLLHVDVHDMEQEKQMQCKQKIHEQMITLRILAKRYSKTRGVMPRLSLGLFSRFSMSPSIVCVLPLPVCNKNSEKQQNSVVFLEIQGSALLCGFSRYWKLLGEGFKGPEQRTLICT